MSTEHPEDVIEGLTDAERDALRAGREAEEAEAAAAGAADDDAEPADAPAEAGEDAETEEAEAEAEEAPAVRPDPVPLIRDEPVEDADAQLTTIRAERVVLHQRLQSGDIDMAGFVEETEKLDDRRDAIKEAQMKSRLSREISEQQVADAWAKECTAFLSAHPEIGAPGGPKMVAFDYCVRQITADEANAKLSFSQQLGKAHKLWAEELRITPKAKDAEPPAEKPKRMVPPTLAKVPASAITDTDTNKFAAVDKLLKGNDPLAVERAIAKMSPSDLDELLRRRPAA